eukprot:563792-Amorphochlora_amoeboformis.AAC.1
MYQVDNSERPTTCDDIFWIKLDRLATRLPRVMSTGPTKTNINATASLVATHARHPRRMTS